MRNRYVEIEDRCEDVKDLLREDDAIAADFAHKFELTLLHHENALEGVVYSIQELEAGLRGVTVAEASVMNGYRAIQNHEAAFAIVREEAASKRPKVTIALLKRLHETLGRGFDREVAELRREMPLHRTYFHEIAQPAKIPGLLQKLVELTDGSDFKSLHPVQKSSRFQHEVMKIFPFTDHAGRIARLVGNLFLVHAGLYPAVVHAVDRQRYYESFRLGEPQLRDLLLESLESQLAGAEKFLRQALRERRRVVR